MQINLLQNTLLQRDFLQYINEYLTFRAHHFLYIFVYFTF